MTLLALFLAAAQAAPIASSPEGHASGQLWRPAFQVCSAVRVVAPPYGMEPADLTFSSRKVLDLRFRARLLKDLPGEHLLQLKVLTPNGFLYQVITVPFVSSTPRQAQEADPPPRYVPGFPRPLPVQRLQPVAGDAGKRTQYELHARLPVAGTSITLSSLYGRWTVQPYLDGQRFPCGPAVTFTIEE